MDWIESGVIVLVGALFTNVAIDLMKGSGVHSWLLWRSLALLLPLAGILYLGRFVEWSVPLRAALGAASGCLSIFLFDTGIYPLVRDQLKGRSSDVAAAIVAWGKRKLAARRDR